MQIQQPFTVADMLKRPTFAKAKVMAGSRGLNRPVRWVHVLEVSDAASFVNGQELILTTGVGLDGKEESVFHFVKQLVECGVSGLCIELVQRFTDIPRSILQYADTCAFPIIVFKEEVRFIEITQDIHACLINRHHHRLVALEAISNRFLQLTLRPQGTLGILKLLHQETGCAVWLRDDWGTDITFPESCEKERFLKKGTCRQPIIALDMQVGELYLDYRGEAKEYIQLILDQAAIAIAQELLRRLSLEERRLRKVQKWIDDCLHSGRADIPAPLSSVLSSGGKIVLAAVHTDLHSLSSPTECPLSHEDIAILQWVRRAYSTFARFGILGWFASHGDLWSIVLADAQPSSPVPFLQRIRESFTHLFRQTDSSCFNCQYHWTVGISRIFSSLSEAPAAWQQAKQALKIRPRFAAHAAKRKPDRKHGERSPDCPFHLVFYDDLHTWQLFLQVDPAVLSDYISHQIGPLLDYDRENGTELVHTLETFLNSGQSKQQTAKALFIHRQTLYYRLEQISSLLGENWDSPSRRLALDTALAARNFLRSQENRHASHRISK
ncbi:PucR family transcriptional regulator ligand-binding domain-containing protein [Thermoactinomyces sp. CICC 10523]|uniref:PucR family transcriptional regulator n=1 Tax=Thermoactinomyces sp. CICC 10523 TaxID=2767428 RepID=UPI0018DE2B53|nr:PucR family transcriptional regulator ligand-binding domain-containing protein [Thermoactinomyces sp. CICC 10523]MBH8599321.1 PucR family transcriptional regulator ligand-binding domain-containing protein [Thermoactinomyces sp. CICC 10523]